MSRAQVYFVVTVLVIFGLTSAVYASTVGNQDPLELEQQVSSLEENPKDLWDKVDASGAVIGGALVALIGAVATYTYNRRKQNQDNLISKATFLGEMIPHLASADERNTEAALVAIGLLDPAWAVTVADIYKDKGGLGALHRLSSSSDESIAGPARAPLRAVFERLSQSVIRLTKPDGSPIATGFLVEGGKGQVVTTDYVAKAGKFGEDIMALLPDGQSVAVDRALHQPGSRLVVFELNWEGPGLPLGTTEDVLMGDYVETLFYTEAGGPSTSSGEVLGYDPTSLIRVRMRTRRGSAGAPVVDRSGRVIGVNYQLVKGEGESLSVPVEELQQLLGSG